MAKQLAWKHHALIQTLLSRGPLSEPDFHAVFIGITGRNPATHRQLFNDVLLMMNKEMGYVQMEVRACRNQYDGSVYYGLVNNSADDVAKLGTKYSIPQIKFFRALRCLLNILLEHTIPKLEVASLHIEAVIGDAANQGFITNIEALNIHLDKQIQTSQCYQTSQSSIPCALKKLSISQKEGILKDLIKEQWLFSLNDKVGLGIRSFLDLRCWFHNIGIPSCDVCNEAALKASTCSNEACNARIHEYCLKKKFSQQKVARVCPNCGGAWPLLESEIRDVRRANIPEPPPRKRGRTCKTEPSYAVLSADPVPRKSTRSRKTEHLDTVPSQKRSQRCKAEAVDAATGNSRKEAPWGAVPRRIRSCKAEMVDAGESRPSRSIHCTDKSTL